jgi:iron-sulfur cluster assembly protein
MAELMTGGAPEVKEDIFVTAKAAEQVRKVKADNNIPDHFALRLGIKGGGCSGFTYVLAFDEKSRPEDREFTIQGLNVYVDPKSLNFLAGTTLDYSDGLSGRGFVFNNPNAHRTCGCGNSFGV